MVNIDTAASERKISRSVFNLQTPKLITVHNNCSSKSPVHYTPVSFTRKKKIKKENEYPISRALLIENTKNCPQVVFSKTVVSAICYLI